MYSGLVAQLAADLYFNVRSTSHNENQLGRDAAFDVSKKILSCANLRGEAKFETFEQTYRILVLTIPYICTSLRSAINDELEVDTLLELVS